jgi:hypothetical protein
LDISIALANAGNIDRALEVTSLIPNEYHKSIALSTISKTLLEAKNFDRVLEVTSLIPDENLKSHALSTIHQALASAGYFSRALEVAKLMTDTGENESKISDICRDLTLENRFEEAIRIAKLITTEDIKISQLGTIAKCLVQADNFERAFDIASSLPHIYSPNSIIYNPVSINDSSETLSINIICSIARELANAGEIETAKKYINIIPVSHLKYREFRKLGTSGYVAELWGRFKDTLNLLF